MGATLSEQRQICLYRFSNCSRHSPCAWQCASKVRSFRFSCPLSGPLSRVLKGPYQSSSISYLYTNTNCGTSLVLDPQLPWRECIEKVACSRRSVGVVLCFCAIGSNFRASQWNFGRISIPGRCDPSSSYVQSSSAALAQTRYFRRRYTPWRHSVCHARDDQILLFHYREYMLDARYCLRCSSAIAATSNVDARRIARYG